MRRRDMSRLLLTGMAGAALPCVAHAAPATVNVGYVPFVDIAQLFVMKAEGWTSQAGINLRLNRFNSGTALVQALASGMLDATYMAVSPMLVAQAEGIDLKIVATNGINSVSLLGVGKLPEAFEGALSPAAAFARFHQITGRPAKLVTLPRGTIPNTALLYYLDTHKVSSNDVQVLVGGAEQVYEELLAQAVDGAAMPEPVLTILLRRNPKARILADGAQLMPGQPGFALAVRESLIKTHPEIVQQLVAFNDQATALIKQNPAQAAKDVLEYMGTGLISPDVMQAALSSPYNPISDDPNLIIASTETLQNFQVKIGAQSRKLPLEDIFDLSFYNKLKHTA